MRAVRSLGVGAAALDDRANTPRLNHTARLLERRGCLLSLTIRLLIKRTARPLERPASVFNARFTNRGTVHSAGIKPRTLDETLAPFWSAFPYVAPTLAGIVAGAAMVRVHQDVRADTAARRAIHARERQLDVLMNLVRHLIIELSTKNLLKICPLKLNRLGLIYGIPRNIDRVGARLPRGHKRAEPDLSRLIRKRPSDNIVYTIRVRENGGEDDRFAGSNLRYIRLQAEEYWCPFHGGGCQIFASRGGFTRVTGLSRPSHCVTARVRARGHGPGHRGHARCRGLIIPTASRKEPREETEVKSCSHVASVPGDADACNPGSQY